MTEKTITVDQELKLKEFLINNKNIVEMWALAHSKEKDVASNPPIYWDDTIKCYFWMNRKQRRAR